MTKPVLLAGLLGGLLGAVFGVALSRVFPPTPKVPPPPPPSEARQFADELVGLLKADKYDEYFKAVRPGFPDKTDEDFKNLRDGVIAMRQEFAKNYGAPGEFEFSRETTLSPSLVRVTYVAKYEQACVGFYVVVYNSPQGWRVLAFNYQTMELAFATLR